MVAKILCLGNITKETNASNASKASLYEHVYDFSTAYKAIAVDDILDIHKFLMEKNKIK